MWGRSGRGGCCSDVLLLFSVEKFEQKKMEKKRRKKNLRPKGNPIKDERKRIKRYNMENGEEDKRTTMVKKQKIHFQSNDLKKI